MQGSIQRARPTRSPRARLLDVAALAGGVLVAGCGGSSGGPTVAAANGVTTSTSSTASTASTAPSRTASSSRGAATTSRSRTATGNGSAGAGPPTQAALESDELAYATCMRANGVPNFPDPRAGGGFQSTGPGPASSSPAYTAAQSKCNRLLPGIGGPGSGPPPSAQTVAHWVTVARCMRRRGISNFPDPVTTVPSYPFAGGGGGEISDRDGVILVFPHTIDMQSPLFTRAAAACGFQLTNH